MVPACVKGKCGETERRARERKWSKMKEVEENDSFWMLGVWGNILL
jgi:hypothetical protein